MNSLKKPKAVIFDWDNTLVDTSYAIEKAIQTMFLRMNVDLNSIDRSGPDNYLSAKDALPKIFADKWQEANDIYQKTYQEYQFEKINLLNGAKKVLDLLRRNTIYMSIVSNKLGTNLRNEVNYLNLNDYFVKIIGSLDAKEDKPSKEAILKALEDSDISCAEDVWFVGDSEIDVLCACNSGCKPIFLGDPSKIALAKFNNVEIIADHNDFLTLLNSFTWI